MNAKFIYVLRILIFIDEKAEKKKESMLSHCILCYTSRIIRCKWYKEHFYYE